MSLLAVTGIRKSFGPVDVLHGVDFKVDAGEVVGLVGDNGAGKSTLMKIVTGMYSADAGDVALEGESILGKTPGERRALGVEMIYQDLALARQQDVAANIFLGREPVRTLMGMKFVDRLTMKRQAQAMIDRLGAKLPAINRPVGSFSGGQQQSVAIARALTFNPKIVIMDEPTAALAVREVQGVLDLIRQLREEGIGVILISHRLNDVLSATDRIVVLHHGRAAANLTTAETNMAEVVSAIVGGSDMVEAAAHEARA
ncbi:MULTISPECIES: ATP-binding cassette domain-containing protein [unclassified Roseitalea]|uniref:ATP-binding cassette domain-containing protein n=1 Tax=unclassified Roseitalea TaxID=2639107 RepID=UPI00273D5404|nr:MULTISPECIES: ATP-binding cassette domain-containing protein [unclassified Roseitalea]